jgi:tetraacyldisaccharide 4'-kinase
MIRRMFDSSDFRELVSGQRRGVTAGLLRAGLTAAEIPYAAVMRLRNRRYDSGRATIHRLPAPMISVGNLTLGGVGKTPCVEWLARWFAARGVRAAVVSRGYGAKPAKDGKPAANDEARELAEKLPRTPHFQHPDRVLAAQRAIDEAGADLVLLDDGFQHRRLARDLDLVLVDACEPFGFEHVFPRGTLREPLAGACRAQAIALTRADMVSLAQRMAIRERYRRLAPQAVWLELGHRPLTLRNASGQEASLETLRGKQVAAFAGIGNPRGFRHTLTQCGYDVAAWREFPDHHHYEQRDVNELARWAQSLSISALLCTHKDLVKLPFDRLGLKPMWAVRIETEVLSGQTALEALLAPLAARAKRKINRAA